MLAEQVALLRGQLKVLADSKGSGERSGARLVLTSAPRAGRAQSHPRQASRPQQRCLLGLRLHLLPKLKRCSQRKARLLAAPAGMPGY